MDAPAEHDLSGHAEDVSTSSDVVPEQDVLATRLKRPQIQPSQSSRTVSGTTDAPPFWTRHGRSISQVSYQSLLQSKPAAIRLEDHSEEDNVQTKGCWARSVTINDYVIISGTSGIGAYVVWNCTVDTLKGSAMEIRKRCVKYARLLRALLTSSDTLNSISYVWTSSRPSRMLKRVFLCCLARV